VYITTNQPDPKSNPNRNPNPNPNPTTKQHAIVNIQLNIVTCPTYSDRFMRDNAVAPFVPVSIVIVTLPSFEIQGTKTGSIPFWGSWVLLASTRRPEDELRFRLQFAFPVWWFPHRVSGCNCLSRPSLPTPLLTQYTPRRLSYTHSPGGTTTVYSLALLLYLRLPVFFPVYFDKISKYFVGIWCLRGQSFTAVLTVCIASLICVTPLRSANSLL